MGFIYSYRKWLNYMYLQTVETLIRCQLPFEGSPDYNDNNKTETNFCFFICVMFIFRQRKYRRLWMRNVSMKQFVLGESK